MFVGWLNQLFLTWKDRSNMWRSTFLCELMSFTEQTVKDGTEVAEQPLAVL